VCAADERYGEERAVPQTHALPSFFIYERLRRVGSGHTITGG
jgi:hypothetical protein